MSAADDVREMEIWSNELADKLAGVGAKLAARAGVVVKAFGGKITDNRAFEFLKGKPRRVDGWEKDTARRRIDELRERERLQREAQHLIWLECEIAKHRASGEELRGPYIDALLDLLRSARGEAGSMAVRQDAAGVSAAQAHEI